MCLIVSLKNYLGYFSWQFATFAVGLGYKPPKKSGNTDLSTLLLKKDVRYLQLMQSLIDNTKIF